MTEQLQKPVFRILHHPEASIHTQRPESRLTTVFRILPHPEASIHTERPESRLTKELYQQYQCPALSESRPRPPQSPIRTTITVTLSAEPRCTALLASLLQAAS